MKTSSEKFLCAVESSQYKKHKDGQSAERLRHSITNGTAMGIPLLYSRITLPPGGDDGVAQGRAG